jgi:hypothetical protein
VAWPWPIPDSDTEQFSDTFTNSTNQLILIRHMNDLFRNHRTISKTLTRKKKQKNKRGRALRS